MAAPAVALGAVPAAAQSTTDAGSASDDIRWCRSDDFKIIENTRGAAAGTVYIEFAMIRIGGEGEANKPRQEPCLLDDRFGVHWIDDYQGDRVGAWAEYTEPNREPFVLEPEGVALMTLAQPSHGNYDPEVCEPSRVAGIQVYLGFHETGGGVYAPTGGKDTVCANPDVGAPRIHSVVKSPY
ncbi:hypothetical protein CDO52_03300 [Nocardiopsis gilva YIM 90087]|uniref:DUF4232 domain-containing protein n=1 Tax=Nocardiopsis gilva YIM 90087 TaxID=1235441 RepID=A0A223SD40_9ACTN|nr:hypothetical protein CDO52_03300 [Nocardiopsis gilva YIM 90087]